MRNIKWIAVACVLLMACEPPAGSFQVVFEWQDGPPDEDAELFVYGSVQHAPQDGDTQTLASAGPESYQKGLQLSFSDVPIGTDRQVVVELRAEPGRAAQVIYYGISERFAMAAGQDTVVPVRIKLVATPGFGDNGEDVGISITNLVTIDGTAPGYATSPEVTLRVISDSAVAVELSNLPDMPDPERIELAEDNEADGTELPRGLSAHELPWDLDRGLDESCGEVDFCTRRVFARFIDAEDYRSPVYDFEVVIDSKPPGIEEGTTDLVLVPSDDNRLVREGLNGRLTRVRTGTVVRVAFALDEVVPQEPIVTATGARDDRIAFTQRGGNGVAFVYELEWTSDEAIDEDQFAIEVEVTDKAGTTSTIDLEEGFVVDTLEPAAPIEPDADSQRLIYARAPWGEGGSGQPYFALRAEPGSVEPGSVVLVLDGADPESAQRIGRAFADEDGGFEAVTLTLADRAEVYALAIDAAGNGLGRATLVRDVEWTAGLAESALGNPHSVDSRSYFLGTLAQVDARAANAAAATEEGDEASVRGGGRFLRGTPIAAPDPRSFTSLVFDRARGQVVSIGGRAFTPSCDNSGSERCERVLEWSGNGFATRIIAGAAPSPRDAVAAMWDAARGEVVVFGGKSAVGAAYCGETTAVCGDTWGYDGTAYRLLDQGGEGAPERRTSSTLVYDSKRGRGVLFGGLIDNGLEALCDGSLFYCGDTWEWDGEQWIEVLPGDAEGPKPSARSDHAAAFDEARGVTVLFGGLAPATLSDINPANGETWEWDGETWTLVLPPEGSPEQPSVRFDAAMAYSSKLGRVVLFGGQTNDFSECDGSGTIFCGKLWSWSGELWEPVEEPAPVLPAPVGRTLPSMVEDAFGNLLLFGGRRSTMAPAGDCIGPAGPCSGVWLFDGKHWRERSGALAGPMPLQGGRYDHSMTYDRETGHTVMFSGRTAPSGECPAAVPLAPRAEAWTWDGNVWTAASLGEAQTARQGSSLVWSDDEAGALLLGGQLEGCDGGTEAYCQGTWAFAGGFSAATPQLMTAPAPRRDASVVTLGDGSVLMLGGMRDRDVFADAWLLDAGAWTAASAGDAPSARFGAAIGYDEASDRVVAFGGATLTDDANEVVTCSQCRCPAAGTFVFQDGEWSELETDDAPEPRFDGQLAYAAERESLVLFAGNAAADCGAGNAVCGDLWELQGDDWYRIEPADPEGDGSPTLRTQHAMVADEARGELLVFGGTGDPNQTTWIWHPGADARPAQVARFDFATTGAPSNAELRELDLTWRANAQSSDGESIELSVWSQGRFAATEALGFEQDDGIWTMSDPQTLSALPYGARRELAFALTPGASNGTHPGYASLSTDFVQLRVAYRLPAGP